MKPPEKIPKNILSYFESHKNKNLNSKYDYILRRNEYILKWIVALYSG
jgi:hypothetical protein